MRALFPSGQTSLTGRLVFFGIFQVGITGLFLSNSCHQPVYAGGIFSGFWHEPLKAIQIQLVLSLLLCIPEIVPSLLFSLYAFWSVLSIPLHSARESPA